jgi:hemerythrin-like domain-containing protein
MEPDAIEPSIDPSKVRDIILIEHANIRRLLQQVEQAARRVLGLAAPQPGDLHDVHRLACRLCAAMEGHVELENQLLAPALELLDAWGKVRADRLRAEHAEQTLMLRDYLSALNGLSGSGRTGPALASIAQQLVDYLRRDMQAEEQCLLRPDLLCDDPTAAVVEAG